MTNHLRLVSFETLAVNLCDSKFALIKYRKSLTCFYLFDSKMLYLKQEKLVI